MVAVANLVIAIVQVLNHPRRDRRPCVGASRAQATIVRGCLVVLTSSDLGLHAVVQKLARNAYGHAYLYMLECSHLRTMRPSQAHIGLETVS